MARQPKQPVLRYEGPFFGLNTTHDPRHLGKAFAQEAENVLVADGLIRPRAPFVPFGQFAAEDTHALSMKQWTPDRRKLAGSIVLVKAVHPVMFLLVGQLWAFGADGAATQIASGLTAYPAQFVVVRDWCYCLDGSERMWKTNGAVHHRMGLPKPRLQWDTGGDLDFLQLDTVGGAGIDAEVIYGMSFYRDTDDVESNAVDFGEGGSIQVPAGGGVRFRVLGDGLPAGEDRVTHVRIYRRNVTLGQTFFRLVGEIPVEQCPMEWVDDQHETEITLSSVVAGPFAPSRNGLPPRATMGAWYEGRLYVNDTEHANRVYYSAVGHPDAFHEDDYLDCSGGETSVITGLAALGGQLFIGKEDGILVHTGPIYGATNETAALGAVPPAGNHTLRETPASAGPCDGPVAPTNGFLVAGDPPRAYYAGLAGFYAFDGLDSIQVTDLIDGLWREFLAQGRARRAYTFEDPVIERWIGYADDRPNRVLYLMVHTEDTASGETFGLAYHYGVNRGDGLGVWTTFRLSEIPPEFTEDFRAICAAGEMRDARTGEILHPATVLCGTRGGRVMRMATAEVGSECVAWKWVSGRIPPGDLRRAMVYGIEWLLSDTDTDQAGTCQVVLGFRINGDSYTQERTANLANGQGYNGEYARQPVGATVADLTLAVRNAAGWSAGWTPGLGVLGFAIDAEVAGHR